MSRIILLNLIESSLRTNLLLSRFKMFANIIQKSWLLPVLYLFWCPRNVTSYYTQIIWIQYASSA